MQAKAELLLLFSNQKNSLLSEGDVKQNRPMLRTYSNGIAKPAEMFQRTAKRLDR